VMINGRLFDAMTMNELGNHPRERGPFWFEREETSDAFVWQGEADAAIHSHGHGHSH
jgi:hypothetical protein